MSTAARIDELRKKFEENPRRYFAPLANELRKAGDLTQAIALCREHLPKQPGHMSGYIVFGQALFESGELDEARTVFEQALALDPENLIALHHLGHIAKHQGDAAGARRWYERALDADPRNDDIARQLAMLATPVRPQPVVPTPVVGALAVPPDSVAADEVARELAFLDTGVPAPRRDLGAIPTPPYPQEAVSDGFESLPLAPTPDAALRAVDFDEVNASLQHPHSHAFAETEAIEALGNALAESGSAPEGPSESPAASFVPSPEPIDLAFEDEPPAAASSVELPLLDVSVDAELEPPAAVVAADDPFAFTDAEPEPPSVPSTDVIDLEAAFEEGLLTAGWPDATEMAARAATPRYATPVSVDVPAAAAEAFGLEPDDAIQASLPEPEPDVLGEEADLLLPAPVPDGQDSLPWLPASDTPTDEIAAIAQAMEDDARANGDEDAVSVTSLEEPAAVLAVEFAEPEAVEPSAVEPVAVEPEAVEPVAVEPVAVEPVAVEPVAVESESVEAEAAETPAFVTETMGELLVAQGFVDRAVAVYEELVRRRPYDPLLAARLAELREQAAVAMPVSVFTARERFAKLAARRVVRRTPARAATPVASATAIEAGREPTPRAAIAIPTPVATPAVTPAATMALPTPSYPTPNDSLAALFGSEPVAQDDFAAQALADAFAPLPMEDTSAAAFETSFLNVSAARTPTPAYGAGRQPTPVAPPPAMPTPVTPVAAETAAGDFSFDRFFPDPAVSSMQGGAPSSGTPAAGSPVFGASAMDTSANASTSSTGGETPASAADDLAQFSAWLKGLGNS